MNEQAVLSTKQKIGYGAGEFSSSIFWITIAFWLMNYMIEQGETLE